MKTKEGRCGEHQLLKESITRHFALTGGDRLLVNQVIDKLEKTPQGCDPVDILIELGKTGVTAADWENKKSALEYAKQLQWEGREFNKPSRIKAGRSLQARILWGKRDHTGD